MIGLIILFNIVGLATTSGTLLSDFNLLPPSTTTAGSGVEAIQGSRVWLAITGIIGLSIIAIGTILGVMGRDASIAIFAYSAAIASTVLLTFVGDLYSISLLAEGWERIVIYAITAPMIAMYIIAAWEWVRGTD